MSDALSQFEEKWLSRLNDGARTTFHYGPTPSGSGMHSALADAFVEGFGFTPIGFNWELLDAIAPPDQPRSAIGELTMAFANDISNPSLGWLGEPAALECAQDLLSAFDSAALTVVSNRYDGLWNPISGASVEWGFVCFDDRQAALLLIDEQS
ncbi:MAG: hypothetical protein HKM91_04820 [Altererythrobacter sp.]|nr:hypothetical protein [Altererythrobacter sp.]NNF93900.1 hypothetical protein [Altererythrobacter sp.]